MAVCVRAEQTPDVVHPFGQLSNHQSHLMQIGISVETVSSLQQLTPAAGVSTTAVDSYREFCVHMLQSCYNYMASFATTRTQLAFGGLPNDEFVPVVHLRTWYENFERRLAQNPNFWKSWISLLFSHYLNSDSFRRTRTQLFVISYGAKLLQCCIRMSSMDCSCGFISYYN